MSPIFFTTKLLPMNRVESTAKMKPTYLSCISFLEVQDLPFNVEKKKRRKEERGN